MAKRISPQETRRRMPAGAMLVCAYDDESKFDANHLEGAMSLSEFKSQADRLGKDREVIFYCA
jgi:rhodanese-related sulfurtransferase